MLFTKYFWIPLIIMITLFFIPFFLTANSLAYDGQAKIGFPFTCFSYGGETVTGHPAKVFSFEMLIVDIFIIILVPFLINLLYVKIIQKS
jgi:hypothetical protein